MQLTVKTLKGEKFVVEAEPSSTVGQVKTIIETQKSELPAANMKLIHSGKVLKDDDTIESCNIKPNAFLVVMISKAKKAATPAPAPAAPAQAPKETPAAPASTTAATTAPTASTESSSTSTPPAANTTSATSESTTTTSAPAPAAPSASSSDSFPPEMVTNLTAMGFPEAEVRACLRASQGNPDVAVEYLMNGIPAYAQQIANASNSTPAPAPASSSSSGSGGGASSSSEPLAALRNHPQINQLRELVQSNPGTLQAVLAQIGQQQPELLQEINSNQELFLQIMNEPVGTSSGSSSTGTSSSTSSAPAPSSSRSPAAGAGAGANPAALMQGMNDPAQMAQMIQSMSPEQVQGLAAMMGMSPEQLTQTAQMLQQMPPEDFQNMLGAAMQMGGGAGGGAPPGAQVVRLTEEEMAAVDRLTEMGFDRNEAVQAYLACDKNEALAANLLMDGGWGGDMDMGGNGAGNDGDDNMYD